MFMFWLFPENRCISERTVKQGINSSYNSIKFCIKKKKKKNFHYVPKLSIGFNPPNMKSPYPPKMVALFPENVPIP